MKSRKLLRMFVVFAIVLSFAAGCGEGSTNTVEQTGQNNATSANGNADKKDVTDSADDSDAGVVATGERDLGGMEITLGIWWQPDEGGQTAYAEARQDYLAEIQQKYNMTIKPVKIADWGQMADIAAASILAGKPEASIFTLDSSKTMGLYKQGLFYPVSNCTSVDLSAEKWNKLVVDSLTFDGNTYGFAYGYEPRNGIFFNKNVLSDAGIDPEEPYNLQAANQWTWDAFKEMCAKTTRDIDNDGQMDYYAICAFHKDTLASAVISNNAEYVAKDENGRFYNATNTTEFLAACAFVHDLNSNGWVRPDPEGANWNWFIEGFNEGNSAFRITEEYSKSDLQNVSFEWGFVFFPKGPSCDELVSVYRENIQIVPNKCFTDEEVDNIMFAYDLYTNKVPGYEDDDEDWKLSAYAAYRDSRAVDETLTAMRLGKNGALRLEPYITGFETGDIAYSIWNNERTPVQLIEEAKNKWDILISEANKMIYGD